MIALESLKEMVAQAAEPGAKPTPHLTKLEQVFAKTLAHAFKKDDEALPAAPAPAHAVNTDLAHQLMVGAAMQMVQGHVAVQAVNIASAASLNAAPALNGPSAKADAKTGAIVLPSDAENAPVEDAVYEKLVGTFNDPLVQRDTSAPQGPQVASATQQAPQVHPGELVQLVARHVSPNQPRVELILQPPELGRVHLNVEVRNNDVHVRVTAENHEVAKVLNDRLPQLEVALREQGLKVGSVSVGQQSAEAGMDTQTSDGRSRGTYDERPEQLESIEQNPPKRAEQRKKRGLDVLA